MQVATAKGRLLGKQPKLSATQQKHLIEVHNAGTHSSTELAELFNVAMVTIVLMSFKREQRKPNELPREATSSVGWSVSVPGELHGGGIEFSCSLRARPPHPQTQRTLAASSEAARQ